MNQIFKRVFALLLVSLVSLFTYGQTATQLIDNDIATRATKQGYVPDYSITSNVPLSNGGRVYYGIQTLNGFPIHGTEFNVVIANSDEINGKYSFIQNAPKLVTSASFALSPIEALLTIKQGASVSPLVPNETSEGEFVVYDSDLSDEPIKIYKKWMLVGQVIVPVYEVSLYEKDHSHWYNTLIDASTGKSMYRSDWVTQCNSPFVDANSPKSNENWHSPIVSATAQKNKKTSGATYTVFAFPVESPSHGSRTTLTDPHNEDASPYGWHDINGAQGAEFTITRGNNVYATEDKDANNTPGYSFNGGNTLNFNAAYDITKSAALYTDASIINLFYSNNVMHDVWWHYGFDEESGNFQANNYGNGGAGNDFVNADAQDGSGTNNANMSTPPDGQNPRMQMYLWNASASGDFFKVNSPLSIAGKYLANGASFGPSLTTVPISGNLVLVNDGSAAPEKGCNALTNGNQVSGNIALVERRDCNFTVKVKNAQNAGAVAVVIYSDNENPIVMGGNDASITIPSVLIAQSTGNALKSALQNGAVSVSLYDSSNLAPNVLDSDFDNGIIAHEYGHGISNRLTGGPMASSCLQNQEQMGEGWSDFFALVMTHEPGDSKNDKRGIGTYASNEPADGDGIRPYPYSVDMSISPYRYDNIKTFSVPHGVGSVWCSMLWDLYWALIDEYGYDSDIYSGTGGNNIAMQLVIDGMKLQKCNPGFADGRDAILLADKLNNGGSNERLIWEVFARRGLGEKASQGSSNDRSDGVEDYSIPAYLLDKLIVEKSTAAKANNIEDLDYSIKILNRTNTTSTNVMILDTLDANVVLEESSISCGFEYENGVLSLLIDSIPANDSFICTYTVFPQFRYVSETLWQDSIEQGSQQWTTNNALGTLGWKQVTTFPHTGTTSWFVANEGSQTDYFLEHEFNLTNRSQPLLSFYHFINSEDSWDGGVVEIKDESGFWLDAKDYFIKNGYSKSILTNRQSNISEREAFTGNSGLYMETILDLSAFAGQEIAVRFRFASDGAQDGVGWFIDDVELIEAVLLRNHVNVTYGNNEIDRASTVTLIKGEEYSNVQKIENNTGISVYPNPTLGDLTIVSDNGLPYTYALMSSAGVEIVSGNGNGKTYIDGSKLAAGVYFIRIKQNGITQVSQVVKL